ncbi:MAG: HAMP domain-containing histidine kinase [Lachnospiraceae bacterium]|nr:HAMP domain-containing histidine kinase [Lachnospiraceae bacterium]
MRLFGKVFLSIFILIMLSFGICGTWMIHATFTSAYNREVEMRNTENEMYSITFKNTVEALPVSYLEKHPDVIWEVAQSVGERMVGNELRVWGEEGNMIYPTGEETDSGLLEYVEETVSGYEIYKEQDRYMLRSVSKVVIQFVDSSYYIETVSDISSVYEQRESMTRAYRIIIVILLIGTALVSILLSYLLTFRIQKLSHITRRFAKGDYGIRADESGRDEISMLAKDFNYMADSLMEKMEELTMHAKNQEAFTSAFAHELKTPLTAIIGYADMIRSMELSTPEKIKAAGYVYSQGKRLEALSLRLMELFVLRKQEFEYHFIDANYLLESVFDLAEIAVLEKDMRLKRQVEKGKIYGEKDLLISLFANLTDNARKASEAGDTIWIKGRNVEAGYEVSIIDEGKGMPKEELSHITQAFYMIDKSRSRKEGGAGLGMTLCYEIVNLHHAEWKIESEEGRGTMVTVVLPVPEEHEEEMKTNEEEWEDEPDERLAKE